MSAQEALNYQPGLRITKGATFSQNDVYRYSLRRAWGPGPMVAFIGLNPSTADALQDDPTIRRCIGFARDWGYDALVMLNLFAYRSTDPKGLLDADDPIGPANDYVIDAVCQQAGLVVEAWGSFPLARDRAVTLRSRLILDGDCCVLGRTKEGHPRHPLYMPKTAVPLGGLFDSPARTPSYDLAARSDSGALSTEQAGRVRAATAEPEEKS